MLRDSNRIRIFTTIDDHTVSNFFFNEFANAEGWVLIHPAVVHALECTRARLNALSQGGEVQIMVTHTTRTPAQSEALGKRLGWTDAGGAVARRSFHLVEFGGVAVDFYAMFRRSRTRYPQWQVGNVAATFFDFVKSDYADGHTHGDLRNLTKG